VPRGNPVNQVLDRVPRARTFSRFGSPRKKNHGSLIRLVKRTVFALKRFRFVSIRPASRRVRNTKRTGRRNRRGREVGVLFANGRDGGDPRASDAACRRRRRRRRRRRLVRFLARALLSARLHGNRSGAHKVLRARQKRTRHAVVFRRRAAH